MRLLLSVQNLNKDRNREQLSSAVEQLPLVSQDPVPAVDDIIGDDTFTIDEAQTKEAEKLAAECAVQKKRRVRSYIQDLRDQLQQLKEANDARPEHQRIGPSYFLVDESEISFCILQTETLIYFRFEREDAE